MNVYTYICVYKCVYKCVCTHVCVASSERWTQSTEVCKGTLPFSHPFARCPHSGSSWWLRALFSWFGPKRLDKEQ